MMKMLLIIAVLMVGTKLGAFGQIRQDTLTWKVGSLRDMNTDSVSAYSCDFQTFGDKRVLWIQQGGEYVVDLKVVSVEGDWEVLSSDGVASYTVKHDKLIGTLEFRKVGNEIAVYSKFMDSGQNTMPFKFLVSSVQKK